MTSLQKIDVPYEQRNNGLAIPVHLPQSQSAFIRQICSLLDLHLDQSLVNVDWLADQLGMPRRTLYRQVKRQLQVSPVELIRLCRLRKAIELLHAGYTVTEVAYRTGFSTPSHFTTSFRKFYKQTPTEYMANRT